MRGTFAILCALLLAAALVAGCGGGALSPREEGAKRTNEGNYQVRAMENGITRGVGIYDNGSFRVLLEGTPRMVIYNRESGEAWLVNLSQMNYETITYEEAAVKASFLPHLVMEPYFRLEQYWDGMEFRMETGDGRSILAGLGGEDFLPTRWEAASRGETLDGLTWEYRRVGKVSPRNFTLPEGLTPR